MRKVSSSTTLKPPQQGFVCKNEKNRAILGKKHQGLSAKELRLVIDELKHLIEEDDKLIEEEQKVILKGERLGIQQFEEIKILKRKIREQDTVLTLGKETICQLGKELRDLGMFIHQQNVFCREQQNTIHTQYETIHSQQQTLLQLGEENRHLKERIDNLTVLDEFLSQQNT